MIAIICEKEIPDFVFSELNDHIKTHNGILIKTETQNSDELFIPITKFYKIVDMKNKEATDK